jgi:hypothetical protein
MVVPRLMAVRVATTPGVPHRREAKNAESECEADHDGVLSLAQDGGRVFRPRATLREETLQLVRPAGLSGPGSGRFGHECT